MDLMPKQMFFTKGVGIHKDKLASFELALRKAGVEKCNLVYVSSIFPPKCQLIARAKGIKLIKPGQITFCVMARNETNEPNRLISAAIGLAIPKVQEHYGYISEHHTYGETARKSGDYAEDLAATMLATTLGIQFDPDEAWDSRKQVYKASNYIFKSDHICQSAEGNKHGKWTTVISAAIMLL
jgi:arginine decarboxylase